MLTRELVKKAKRIEISSRRLVDEMLGGQYQAVFKGRGLVFSDVRPYADGDDVRFIDWNVSARMNHPHVKQFVEERDRTINLMIDLSGSSRFGSRGLSKRDLGAELAAVIALAAVHNNDRVGLILFSDRVEKVVPPRKGKKHVLRVVSDILSFKPVGKGTNLNAGLDYLSRIAKRKAVTFLISDFLTSEYEKALRIAARRHDLVPVVLADPFEADFPALGLVDLEDAETGQRWLVDTSDPRVRGRFRLLMESQRDARTRTFRKLHLDHVELKAGEDYAGALQRFFRARSRRMAA